MRRELIALVLCTAACQRPAKNETLSSTTAVQETARVQPEQRDTFIVFDDTIEKAITDTSAYEPMRSARVTAYSRNGNNWDVSDTTFQTDLVLYRNAQGSVMRARYLAPHSLGYSVPAYDYRFGNSGNTTDVEKSWDDHSNGCAESVTVIRRWKIENGTISGFERRVLDQDGYDLNGGECRLGVYDVDTIYTSWTAFQRAIKAPR